MTANGDGYRDNRATVHFPEFGEPPGLTRRQARDWRRANTWYITNGEKIAPEVLADPPACFTPKEWAKWLPTLPYGGFKIPGSPSAVQGELPHEALARQQRATRAAACSDCMLERQMRAEEAGVCHPPQYAVTPRNCRQPMRGAEGCPDHGHYCMSAVRQALGMEGSTDGAAPGVSGQGSDVRNQEGVPE